jgi:hypothetical protein
MRRSFPAVGSLFTYLFFSSLRQSRRDLWFLQAHCLGQLERYQHVEMEEELISKIKHVANQASSNATLIYCGLSKPLGALKRQGEVRNIVGLVTPI